MKGGSGDGGPFWGQRENPGKEGSNRLIGPLLFVLDEARGEKAPVSNGRILPKIGCQGKRLGT